MGKDNNQTYSRASDETLKSVGPLEVPGHPDQLSRATQYFWSGHVRTLSSVFRQGVEQRLSLHWVDAI